MDTTVTKTNIIKAHNLERVIYPVLSFVIPAIIILAALAGLKVTPFGDNSLAISDGNGLYINYMGYVSGVLKGERAHHVHHAQRLIRAQGG